MRRAKRFSFSAVGFSCGLLLHACTPSLPEGVFACTVDTECPAPLVCDETRQRCVRGTGSDDAGMQSDADSGHDASVGPDDGAVDATADAGLDGGGDATVDAGLDGGITCDLAMDTDTDVIDLTLSHLASGPTTGIDVDGLNNQATAQGGLGPTIEGCGRLDTTGGVDNAFEGALSALSGAVDFHPDIAASILTSPPGSGVTGRMQIRVRITHVAAGQPANDPCVGVELHVDRGEGPEVISTRGALTDNLVTANFGTMPLPLRFGFSPTALGCDGTCAVGDIDLVARHVQVRLALDALHTRIEATSRIAGVFFDAASGNEYFTMTAYGVTAALAEWAAQANVSVSIRPTLEMAFSAYRDAYLQWNGNLAACASTVDPPSAQFTNRNAISFGFGVDSLP